jgi:hypothetical protein
LPTQQGLCRESPRLRPTAAGCKACVQASTCSPGSCIVNDQRDWYVLRLAMHVWLISRLTAAHLQTWRSLWSGLVRHEDAGYSSYMDDQGSCTAQTPLSPIMIQLCSCCTRLACIQTLSAPRGRWQLPARCCVHG